MDFKIIDLVFKAHDAMQRNLKGVKVVVKIHDLQLNSRREVAFPISYRGSWHSTLQRVKQALGEIQMSDLEIGESFEVGA